MDKFYITVKQPLYPLVDPTIIMFTEDRGLLRISQSGKWKGFIFDLKRFLDRPVDKGSPFWSKVQLAHITEKNKDLLTFPGLKDYIIKHFYPAWLEILYASYSDMIEKDTFKIGIVDQANFSGTESEVGEIKTEIGAGYELRDYQIDLVREAIKWKHGTIVAAPGAGKTVIMGGLWKNLGEPNMIIVVPTIFIRDQTIKFFKSLGCDAYTSGELKVFEPGVVVGTAISLQKYLDNIGDAVNQYKVFCIDEYHHIQARTWFELLVKLRDVEYKIGFTGTLYRRSSKTNPSFDEVDYLPGKDLLTYAVTGRILGTYKINDLVDQGVLSKPHITMVTLEGTPVVSDNYHYVVKKLVDEDKHRAEMALTWALDAVDAGKLVLMLVNTKRHAKYLLDYIPPNYRHRVRTFFGNNTMLEWDGLKWAQKRGGFKELNELVREGEVDLILATTVFNEGVDLPSINVLILLSAGRSYTKVLQLVGRGLRKTDDKDSVCIIDFYDRRHGFLISQARQRLKYYRDEGFEIIQPGDMRKLIRS